MGKKLGQHFLNSKAIAQKLIGSASLTKNQIVLEIGAGKGFLTKLLLEQKNKIYAIEKDLKMVSILNKKFEKEIKDKKLILIKEDVRDANIFLKVKNYSVVANIPYYLTGSILKKLLECKNHPKTISLLVQKEIAERIAKDKKESLLSLSIKFFGKPKYIKTVSKKFFTPVPKVDSAILLITDIKKRNRKEIEKFFEIIHIAFRGKRKIVLKKFNQKERKKLEELGVNSSHRAEDIDIGIWEQMSKN